MGNLVDGVLGTNDFSRFGEGIADNFNPDLDAFSDRALTDPSSLSREDLRAIAERLDNRAQANQNLTDYAIDGAIGALTGGAAALSKAALKEGLKSGILDAVKAAAKKTFLDVNGNPLKGKPLYDKIIQTAAKALNVPAGVVAAALAIG